MTLCIVFSTNVFLVTWVRPLSEKHLDNMNAQRVWEEFATHMTTSSKGKAEKHRLHTYVTTTVLDKSWKGTTEQFILHFNEQFRQLDEVSPPEESLPYTTRLSCMSMPIMVEATPSTLQVKLNGFRTRVMTNPFMWEGNKLSTFLMAIPPLSNVGLVSCT